MREGEDAIDWSLDTGPSGWREGTATAETWVWPAMSGSVRARPAKCEFCSCCLLSIAKGWRWFPCHQSKILLPLNHPPCLGAASNAC